MSWCVDAPIELVFAVLDDSAAYPEWWKGVTAVEVLEPGDADGVGQLARFSWRSVLPHTLRFDTRVSVMQQGGIGLARRLGASLLLHE